MTNEPNIKKLELSQVEMKRDIKYLVDGIDKVNNKLDCLNKDYVGRIEFELVKKDQDKRVTQIEKLVYGAVGLAVITLGKAVLDLVVTVNAIK